MGSQEIIFSKVSELTESIRNKEISCIEVVKAFLGQIYKYNELINAISDIRSEQDILAEAQEKDKLLQEGIVLGPLHGIPMTVKDGFCVQGLKSTNGNPSLKNNIPDYDATLIKRLKQAGAIIIGKSNIALFALDWQTDNGWFGRTNNPYDVRKIVGGSSGGSAAALAAGFTPLELGTDAGGSIRVPAHFCGVCGIRTTEFALPNRGNMVVPKLPKLGRYLVSNGGMARNIDDLTLLTDVLWNGKIKHTENPPVPFKRNELIDRDAIKIAYADNLGQLSLSQAYENIYKHFIRNIKRNFQSVSKTSPTYDEEKLTLLWGAIAGYDFAAALKNVPGKSFIAKWIIKLKYKHDLWAKAMAKGSGGTAYNYAIALEHKDEVGDQFNAFFDNYDVWITPVAAKEAFDHHKTGKSVEIDGEKVAYGDVFIPYNFPSTLPGHPIVVIPIGMTSEGLPVGVQIHGKRWHDYRLLQIAKELEKLTDGFIKPDIACV